MPPKRKVVYLSRFFEENVELVANMCVKCYQQEDEVKVTAINRNFSNAIKSKRLESLQKKRKLKETNSENISSDFITQQLDEKFDENTSVSTDSEEPSLDLHDSSSSGLEEDSSSNLTSTSNVSLNETISNIVSQSINNSCHFLDNDDTFDQTCDTLSNNTDKITDCENTCKKFEHISKDTEATFKNSFNNVINNEDNDENTTPNNISSSASVENSGETIWNNILKKIKSKSQYEEDTSYDCSEENFNFFQDCQAKTEHTSTEKISVTSQSIFKTLNSKNSRLYDDFNTNINSRQNYNPKSVKYNVNAVQLEGCTGTLSNGDLTSVNNDKRCVSSSQYNEEIIKSTNDDSIFELINRIHSPIRFLTDNNKINVAKEEQINALKEDKLIEETQDYKIIEDKPNLEEIKTIEENIIEVSNKEESCFSQYFSQKSINNVPEKYIQCSEKDRQIVSEFSSPKTNKEEPKRKINFSKLKKKF